MRFGIPDPEDEEDLLDLDYPYDSDESTRIIDNSRRKVRSKLGKSIRAAFDSSDSEVGSGSEDEVGDLLDDDFLLVHHSPATEWREPSLSKRKGKGKAKATLTLRPPSSLSASRRAGPSTWHRHEPSVRELLQEDDDGYTEWLKEIESAAWREGHRVANERRRRLREIESNVKIELSRAQNSKRDREADELRRMMEGLELRAAKEEEDMAKRFSERVRKLWADVDAGIKAAEEKAAQAQAQAAAAARKLKEEEAARVAAEEKAALARKADADRIAREQAEKARADKAERDRLEAEAKAKLEADKAAEDKRRASAAEVERSSTVWAEWTERQRWMKKQVIEVVKNDNLRSPLRPGLRLITRGLGQVVNTQESIVRVTNDLHSILLAQLPSPPSLSAPTSLDTPPPVTYSYLLSHLSKALIKQAENEVSAKADAAFPLARIVLGLILRGHGALAHVLFARLVKKCPWVVPHYPVRSQNQSREEYEKSTGRGTDESIADYIARMSGISTLYFAILQTPLDSLVSTFNSKPTPQQLAAIIPAPFRLPAAWTWLALSLRGPLPGLPPTAHLIAVLFDIAGAELVAVFGVRQVGKLLDVIEREGLGQGKIKGDSEASRQRLKLLLEAAKTEGLKPHEGRNWT